MSTLSLGRLDLAGCSSGQDGCIANMQPLPYVGRTTESLLPGHCLALLILIIAPDPIMHEQHAMSVCSGHLMDVLIKDDSWLCTCGQPIQLHSGNCLNDFLIWIWIFFSSRKACLLVLFQISGYPKHTANQ